MNVAKHDELSTQAEAHEELTARVCDDGIITPSEHTQLMFSARRLRLMVYRQGIRIKLGTRMIRGGAIDRRLLGEIQDYQELCRKEKAASQWKCNAA